VPLTIELPPDLQREVEREAAIRGIPLSDFIATTLADSLQLSWRPDASRPLSEAALLARNNRGVPTEVWRRYSELVIRRRADLLTLEEHAELTGLSDMLEERHAERLGYVSQLAQLRGVSFDTAMKQLGITPRPL
jgi:hypothetical protein